jgi:hypothetical protein
MRMLKMGGFVLFSLVFLRLFAAADNRGQHNNPEGLPSDMTHLPGGDTSSGETTPLAGNPGSPEPPGTKPTGKRGGQSEQTPAAQDAPGELGWSATGTPGAGGETGQKAHDRKQKA